MYSSRSGQWPCRPAPVSVWKPSLQLLILRSVPYQQLLAEGATPDEAKRIVDNFRLAWDVYDSLTAEQKTGLDDCRIDQVNFFDRPSP